jgi:Ca2+-transporting ATPase
MTVTHIYATDDLVDLTPHLHHNFGPRHPNHADLMPSPAMLKTALVGNICNNAFRNEQGINVGQATEVALLNVLPVLGKDDERKVSTR